MVTQAAMNCSLNDILTLKGNKDKPKGTNDIVNANAIVNESDSLCNFQKIRGRIEPTAALAMIVVKEPIITCHFKIAE